MLESDLTAVENQIKQKEKELGTVLPQWEAHRAKESREKRKAQEASTRLEALFAKQGRVNRFRTKAERDNFLENEVTSLGSYQATRTSALETTRTELDSARQSLAEVQERMEGVQGRMEDGRKRTNDLTEQIKSLKEDQVDLVERRKELWREDTRLQSLVTHASDEKRSAENNLASMMDKVWLHLRFSLCSEVDIPNRTPAWVYVLSTILPIAMAWTVFMALCTVCLKSQTKSSISQLS